MLEVGSGKADITAFVKGVGMMGYGMFDQKVEDVETPLSCRAFVFNDTETGKKIVFANAEMCFITISVKQGVIKRLNELIPDTGFDFDNVMLTAQHTHNAAGGYSHYAFFNFSIPGFVPEVYDQIVNGIADSIIEANNNLKPATLKFGKGYFAPEDKVAFNRSMKAYNANPDVEKLKDEDWHLALDREMSLLRVDGETGEAIGSINWFGVHTTSIGKQNKRIHYDNKGCASADFEKDQKDANPDFNAIFAQAPCGDVMPNFIWEPKRDKMRGIDEDDFKSAAYNGSLQFNKAKEIFENAAAAEGMANTALDYGLMNVDFSNVSAGDEFIPDGVQVSNGDAATGPACLGVAFFKGTVDGKGIGEPAASFATLLARTNKSKEQFKSLFSSRENCNRVKHKYKTHGKKDILIETGERKVLGNGNINALGPLGAIDPTLAVMKQHYRNGGLSDKPWTPQVLPLQFFIIGSLAIVGIPAEVSVVAGRRLKKTIEEVLKERGVHEVILSPYANCYSGYITTYEEYQHQLYEAGHTVFGQWTHAAYSTKLKYMAREMLKPESERNFDEATQPDIFSEEDLAKRSFSSVG